MSRVSRAPKTVLLLGRVGEFAGWPVRKCVCVRACACKGRKLTFFLTKKKNNSSSLFAGDLGAVLYKSPDEMQDSHKANEPDGHDQDDL